MPKATAANFSGWCRGGHTTHRGSCPSLLATGQSHTMPTPACGPGSRPWLTGRSPLAPTPDGCPLISDGQAAKHASTLGAGGIRMEAASGVLPFHGVITDCCLQSLNVRLQAFAGDTSLGHNYNNYVAMRRSTEMTTGAKCGAEMTREARAEWGRGWAGRTGCFHASDREAERKAQLSNVPKCFQMPGQGAFPGHV